MGFVVITSDAEAFFTGRESSVSFTAAARDRLLLEVSSRSVISSMIDWQDDENFLGVVCGSKKQYRLFCTEEERTAAIDFLKTLQVGLTEDDDRRPD